MNAKDLHRLYHPMSREEREADLRDNALSELYRLDLRIRQHIYDCGYHSLDYLDGSNVMPVRQQEGIDFWLYLQRGVQEAMEAIRDYVIPLDFDSGGVRRSVSDVLERQSRNLRDIVQHSSGCHIDVGALCIYLNDCGVTKRLGREVLDTLTGGHMVFPGYMEVEHELEVRAALQNCISVTIDKAPKGGIQRAMAHYGAIGASIIGTAWQVWFTKDEKSEEQALLMKCAC